MSTKEMAYSIIDTLTEEQLEELMVFLKGYSKKTTSVDSVFGILSGRSNGDYISQEKSVWEKVAAEKYEAPWCKYDTSIPVE